MSDELRAGHEGLGDGEGHKAIVGGQDAAGEAAGKYPEGIHIIVCGAGKAVCDKSTFIKRFQDFWKDSEALKQGHGIAFLGEHDGREAFRGHVTV